MGLASSMGPRSVSGLGVSSGVQARGHLQVGPGLRVRSRSGARGQGSGNGAQGWGSGLGIKVGTWVRSRSGAQGQLQVRVFGSGTGPGCGVGSRVDDPGSGPGWGLQVLRSGFEGSEYRLRVGAWVWVSGCELGAGDSGSALVLGLWVRVWFREFGSQGQLQSWGLRVSCSVRDWGQGLGLSPGLGLGSVSGVGFSSGVGVRGQLQCQGSGVGPGSEAPESGPRWGLWGWVLRRRGFGVGAHYWGSGLGLGVESGSGALESGLGSGAPWSGPGRVLRGQGSGVKGPGFGLGVGTQVWGSVLGLNVGAPV